MKLLIFKHARQKTKAREAIQSISVKYVSEHNLKIAMCVRKVRLYHLKKYSKKPRTTPKRKKIGHQRMSLSIARYEPCA